ncbi:DIS3-like exonuclease 2, partial [Rhizophlyctis rosea]
MHKKERRRTGRDSLGETAGQDVREQFAHEERRENRGGPRTPRGGRGDYGPQTPAARNRGGPTTPSSGRGGGRLWVDPDQKTPNNNNNHNRTPAAATPKRPNVYEEYLTLEEVSRGLEDGTLLQGSLRINKRNRYDAYCAIEGSENDIFICGVKNRNRALEGDVVAVKLLEGATLERELDLQKEKRVRRKEENRERQA